MCIRDSLQSGAAAAAAAPLCRLAPFFAPFRRRDVLLRPGRALGLGAGLRRRRHGVELGRGGPAWVVGHEKLAMARLDGSPSSPGLGRNGCDDACTHLCDKCWHRAPHGRVARPKTTTTRTFWKSSREDASRLSRRRRSALQSLDGKTMFFFRASGSIYCSELAGLPRDLAAIAIALRLRTLKVATSATALRVSLENRMKKDRADAV